MNDLHPFAVVHDWSDGWIVVRSLGSAPDEIVMQVRDGAELVCSLTVDDTDSDDGPFVHPPSHSRSDREAGAVRFVAFVRSSVPEGRMMESILSAWRVDGSLRERSGGIGLVELSVELNLLTGTLPAFWCVGREFQEWLPYATFVDLR